jgi:hypothetical protein
MRKGYGPTHVSYHLPLEKFTAMVKNGINIAQGVDDSNKVLYSTLPSNLSADSIKRIFDDADCVAYHEGVQMIIPRHLA